MEKGSEFEPEPGEIIIGTCKRKSTAPFVYSSYNPLYSESYRCHLDVDGNYHQEPYTKTPPPIEEYLEKFRARQAAAAKEIDKK